MAAFSSRPESVRAALQRCGLFGWSPQLRYGSPVSCASIVMHHGTGHTSEHRLQPTQPSSRALKVREFPLSD